MTQIDIEQLRADIAAGTPGPWVNDGPTWNAIIWSDNGNRIAFMAHSNGLNDARDEANARRIARVPDLEAAYLALADETARMRGAVEALGAMPDGYCFCSNGRIGDDSKIHEPECAELRAALGETK